MSSWSSSRDLLVVLLRVEGSAAANSWGRFWGKFARSKFAWACSPKWVPAKRSGRGTRVDWRVLARDVWKKSFASLSGTRKRVHLRASFICKSFEEAADVLVPQQNTPDNITSSRIQTAKPVSPIQCFPFLPPPVLK